MHIMPCTHIVLCHPNAYAGGSDPYWQCWDAPGCAWPAWRDDCRGGWLGSSWQSGLSQCQVSGHRCQAWLTCPRAGLSLVGAGQLVSLGGLSSSLPKWSEREILLKQYMIYQNRKIHNELRGLHKWHKTHYRTIKYHMCPSYSNSWLFVIITH